MGERPGAHGLVEHGVLDAIELEPEEKEFRRGGGQALLGVAIELRADRIRGVAGIDQAGIGHEASEKVFERLVALHHLVEPFRCPLVPRHLIELAAIGGGERLALGLGPGEIALERLAVHAGIEMGEVPFGQGPEFGLHGAGTGGMVRGRDCLNGHGRRPA